MTHTSNLPRFIHRPSPLLLQIHRSPSCSVLVAARSNSHVEDDEWWRRGAARDRSNDGDESRSSIDSIPGRKWCNGL